jgi:chromosome segregation ATPase
MAITRRGDKEGAVNIKLYLLPLVIGGLFLGLGLSQAHKKEISSVKRMQGVSVTDNLAAKKGSSALPGNNLLAPAGNSARQGLNGKAKEADSTPRIRLAQAKDSVGSSSTGAIRDFDMEKSLSRVKGYIKEMESQNISLKERVAQLSGVLEAREKELVGLDKENSCLKNELDKAGKAQGELRAELDSGINGYKEQLSRKEADLSSLAAVKMGLENQITELSHKFSELASVNSYLEKQITQNQQDRSSLSAELNTIKEELDRRVLVNETLNKKVAELNSSLSAKEQERLNIVNKMEAAGENKKALDLEISQLKTIKEGNEKRISELNSKISELNTSGETILDKFSGLSDVLARKEIEIGNKQKELFSLKEALNNANKEKDALILVLDKKEKSLSELNSALERMKSQVSSLKAELRRATERQSHAAAQLNKMAASGSSPEQINRIIAINKSLQEKIVGIYEEMELLRLETRMRKNSVSQQ